MKIRIEITYIEIKSLLQDYLESKLGDSFSSKKDHFKIEVKSKQNYKSEWEVADFRAIYQNS